MAMPKTFGFTWQTAKQLRLLAGGGLGEFSQSSEPAVPGGGSNVFIYEIITEPTTGSPTTAKVDIFDKDDESTLIAEDQDWIGNLEMFDDHEVGSRGICVKVGSVYVAVNAPCDTTSTSGGSSPVHIGPSPPTNTAALWIDTSSL